MVLSNKKLKQKIKAELAESLAASVEAQNKSKPKDLSDPYHNSFKSLLDSVTQKPRLSKREKRRGKDINVQKEDEEIGTDGVKKLKKRKRDGGDEQIENGFSASWEDSEGGTEGGKKPKILDNGISGDVEGKKLKSKKNKKKKQKKKKRAGKMEVKKGVESVNGVSDAGQISGMNKQSVAETIKASDSQENVDISTKVYVGGIPYYSTEDDIRSFFEGCGTITKIDCMTFPDTGKFRGIAIISFKTEEATKRALALDGADMGGLFLKIQPYKSNVEKKVSDFSPAVIDGYNRIYAGNLSWDISEEDLRKFFSDFSISKIRFGEDKETKEFRGYAHVDFADSLCVTMALKLDQKMLCGRPVRIRCAVPAKKTTQSNTKPVPLSKNVDNVEVNTDNVDSNTVSGKSRQRTCYECGEKGHLTSSCPKKQDAETFNSVPTGKNADNTEVITDSMEISTVSRKIRRRTCYECGEKGHLTSSCPKKQAGDSLISVPTGKIADNVEVTDNMEISDVSGKMKRRKCYECGEKGHLTSSCPNKQANDSLKSMPNGEITDNVEVITDNKEISDVSGKLKRRKCYECGEKGHLTSNCPNRQADDTLKSIPTFKNANNVEVSAYNVEVSRGTAEPTSGKIRRRTCYECGEKGHLSSSCSKKQVTSS